MATVSPIERLRSEFPELKLVHDTKRVASQLIQEIHALSNQDLCGGAIQDNDLAQAVRAGFLLAAGGLEEAHGIVQKLETAEAYYWHGIVHRREPDWSNAKYWFRQLGHHPVFDKLTKMINLKSSDDANAIFPSEEWDPFKFVDLCKACESGNNSEAPDKLLLFQQYEIEKLLEYCLRGAIR